VVASINTHEAASIGGGVRGNGMLSSACAHDAQIIIPDTVTSRRLFNTSSSKSKNEFTAARFTANSAYRSE
jgi:hypothetical protein